MILKHTTPVFSIILFANYAQSLNCWNFSDTQFQGTIQKTPRIQSECPGNYCMTLSEEGDDFNVFNGTCPDPSVVITDCETRGNGCQKETIREVYIKVCCCNTDLCNYSKTRTLFLTITILFIINFN
ncbi:unnamed protein product [Caenorhabditis angaria]|uniref:UPAR/Ly6 domain-containing protein n=1 Tax=Caenorhabditis angaria TaxID=860376 RepID=A0A9P1J5Q0_9PELO|nr:unnamed protein product [Caenorhabditis angaria]